MSNKEFTKEEIEELRKSKWILDVSPKSMDFYKYSFFYRYLNM